jgi:hypothetical protein
MFYRVVLQGRAAGDQDMDSVKREFARVTGMPADVTERLFARTPHPLKERVSQADADRIAATLRAIGAAVTVERDLLASLEAADGRVHEIVPPDHRGPPTVVPGSEPAPAAAPPTAAQRLQRRLRPYLPVVVGAPVAVVLLLALAPYADDAVRALRPAQAARFEPVKPAPAPAQAPAPIAPRSASLLHGPWRCTDQRTGLATYWTFGADGTLTYHGETFKERAVRTDDPSVPTGWAFADDRLQFAYAQKSPATFAVSDLSLTRLRYGDGRDVDTQCRRP